MDAATSKDRQVYTFNKVIDVLNTDFDFEDKDIARRYFLELRLLFTDLNYIAFDDAKFKEQEEKIIAKISERAQHA